MNELVRGKLKFDRAYPDDVMRDLSLESPVPADCPAFRLANNPKLKQDWDNNYVPYKGKDDWCSRYIALELGFCNKAIFSRDIVTEWSKNIEGETQDASKWWLQGK